MTGLAELQSGQVAFISGLLGGFALSVAAIAFGAMEFFGVERTDMPGIPKWVQFIIVLFYSVCVYVLFLAFMMWAESIRRVRESQARLAQEAVLRAEAEAKAVRAQFNPHFVFNTLHSLMLLVRADPDAAERAIEDVATLIRYASIVQREDLDVVALEREVEVSQRYLGLEKLRLADRLKVEWDVEDGVGSVLIPAFALQTLVENAVKHGIEPSTEGGTVRVSLSEKDGTLEAVVSDDGAGADPDRVDQKGHGIHLLSRRLEVRYGDSAGVSWKTAPGTGFVVTVRLPAERSASQPELDVLIPASVG